MEKKLVINDQELKISLISRNDKEVVFDYNGKPFKFQVMKSSANSVILKSESGEQFKFNGFANSKDKSLDIFYNGFEANLKFLDGAQKNKAKSVGSLLSPMPGKIIKVLVSDGQTVKKGDPLIILEAMNMEHTIKAGIDGVVEKVFFKEGDQVQGQTELIKLGETRV